MLWLLPVAPMLLIAALHAWRVRHRRQSCWKGGGFGMFSDISRNFTYAELHARTRENAALTLRVVDSGPWWMRLEMTPSDKVASIAGRTLLSQPWIQVGGVAVRYAPEYKMPPLSVSGLTLVRATCSFDGRTGTYAITEVSRDHYTPSS